MTAPDGIGSCRIREQLCPGKDFKNQFTNVLLSTEHRLQKRHDISHFSLVVKALVSFMLNSIGLLLGDVFIGFSEAPIATFSKKKKRH